ncbi:hypothetical protein E2C01_036174 [Portunus trituberculatus]|uniref:Uncharacterized protein n=1 Tax=Portunus trituberculatus TaxID=210409 RepID=A0A5B7F640_PORTR|nr:hypothetical protein [Portunus trituberculatus]
MTGPRVIIIQLKAQVTDGCRCRAVLRLLPTPTPHTTHLEASRMTEGCCGAVGSLPGSEGEVRFVMVISVDGALNIHRPINKSSLNVSPVRGMRDGL